MSSGCVLVLDNNQHHAQFVARMLHQQKWTSVLSFNQAMAFRALKSSRFRLLLFDAYVDGSNVLKLMDEIKTCASDTPLAILSDSVRGGGRDAAQVVREQGADFILTKPVSDGGLKTLLTDTNEYHRARRTEHHILVIEDNVDLRTEMCRVLQQVGYNVASAANMEDAFFDHDLGLYNVVVTAVLIPGIGGIEGTAQIRKDWPHIHVIAISQGVNDKIAATHVLAAATEAGAEAVLAKPFSMTDLLQTVASVIRGKTAPADQGPASAVG